MAFLAGTTLVWKGTPLARVWLLNATAYEHLAPFGELVGILFLILGALLALAAIGWMKRRLWAWWLAVMIIATQVLGNTVNLALGHVLDGVAGILLAGALLFYLLRPKVRSAFLTSSARSDSETIVPQGH